MIFSSWIGVVGAVLLLEPVTSWKLCTDPERDVDTLVYNYSFRKLFLNCDYIENF